MPYHRESASFEERVAASIAATRVEMLVLGVGLLLVLGFGAWGFVRAGDATDQARVLARQEARLAQATAQEAVALATAQRASRLQAFRDQCAQQNVANVRIDRLLIAITPARKRRATPHFYRVVRSLADAFDPRHPDCQAYARARVGPPSG